MFRHTLYYGIKPLVPASVRLAVRRWFALRKRDRVLDTWPILPGSEKPPAGWPGWPDGKQFALVLTHDVEGLDGLVKSRPLMELEMKLGFRSVFNFVPEGDYRVSKEFRDELIRNGFEVGVHDLYHDGKLYRTRAEFRQNATDINRYLKDWGAVGFRSGFMLHNLEWLHDLDVAYDTSTFDTDPFEPQPDGVATIFPFWVPRTGDRRQNTGDRRQDTGDRRQDTGDRSQETGDRRQNTGDRRQDTGDRSQETGVRSQHPGSSIQDPASSLQPPASSPSPSSAFSFQPSAFGSAPRAGYVELPYTLPQDSTLFLLFRERHPDIWFQKLDWIARHGGMALVDTHPDFMGMNGSVKAGSEYPLNHYEAILKYAKSRYPNAYWHALPRDVARHWKEITIASRPAADRSSAAKRTPTPL